MRLIIKTNSYKAENGGLEILTNMEDFYAMLDRVNPVIIENYIKNKTKA